MAVCVHTRRCRHHWVSTSAGVCVSQRVSVSVWVVGTRNNTLPWDLLNGHHLSLSGKALGKLMPRLRCFSPAASWNELASLPWEKKEENCKTKFENTEKNVSYSVTGSRWKRGRMKSDCWLHFQGWRVWFSVVFTMLESAVDGTQNISIMDMTCHIVPMQTDSVCGHTHKHIHTHFHKEQHLGKLPVCLALY